MNLEELKNMKKSGSKRLLKKVVADKVFKKLTDKKESHSKVMGLKHDKLKMQNYFKSNKLKISQNVQIKKQND